MGETQIYHAQNIGCASGGQCRRELLRLLHAGFSAVFVPMNCYLEHITMGLLRLQASANEERAIEIAARILAGALPMKYGLADLS